MSKTSFLVIAVVVILGIIKLLTEFLTHILTQDKENRLRAQLEQWKRSALEDSSVVFLPLFEIPAGILARVFGTRSVSWRSFRNSAIITSLLLVICFALAVVFNGFDSPFKLFTESTELLKKQVDGLVKLPGDYSQFRRNVSDLAGMNGPLPGTLYTVFFFLISFGVTALFAFLTLAFCRRLLHTATQVKDLFSLCVILVSNLCGVTLLLILQCSILSILLYPAFWPMVPPLLRAFGQAPVVMSILTAIVSLFAPLFYWLASASWLRIAVVFSLSPCLLVSGLILVNLLTRLFKQTCSGYMVSFLNVALSSRRGVLQFFSFCLGAAVTLCSFVVWLAQLKLTALLVGALCVLSLARTVKVNEQRGVPALSGFIHAICILLGAMAAVTAGYYIQALIECIRLPTSAPASLADPLFSSLVPGAWLAAWFVHVTLHRRPFWRATSGYFMILMLVDLWRALLGEIAYSDFIVGIPYNIVGAPLGTWAISKMDQFLFPQRSASPAPRLPQEPAPVT